MTKKLEETFNLEPSEEFAELEARYQASDNPDLKEVARMALDAYAELMKDVSNFEAKYRARNVEVAQTFLNLAKDALAKDIDLRLKEEKQNQTKEPTGEETPDGETFDRDAFLVDLKAAGKKK